VASSFLIIDIRPKNNTGWS